MLKYSPASAHSNVGVALDTNSSGTSFNGFTGSSSSAGALASHSVSRAPTLDATNDDDGAASASRPPTAADGFNNFRISKVVPSSTRSPVIDQAPPIKGQTTSTSTVVNGSGIVYPTGADQSEPGQHPKQPSASSYHSVPSLHAPSANFPHSSMPPQSASDHSGTDLHGPFSMDIHQQCI